jgi:hypothetical protein
MRLDSVESCKEQRKALSMDTAARSNKKGRRVKEAEVKIAKIYGFLQAKDAETPLGA